MAKKRGGGNKAGANGNNGSGQAAAPSRASDDASGQAAAEQQEETQRPVQDLSPEELRAELQAARDEIASLRAQLSAGKAGQAGKLAVQEVGDVPELRAKLQVLRKEQEEANAARDAAWKQLKAVVQEISSLANPSYLQSLVVKPQEA